MITVEYSTFCACNNMCSAVTDHELERPPMLAAGSQDQQERGPSCRAGTPLALVKFAKQQLSSVRGVTGRFRGSTVGPWTRVVLQGWTQIRQSPAWSEFLATFP